MKARVILTAIVCIFIFAINNQQLKAETGTILYHNVEKSDNVISTTYMKGDADSKNLVPFKKKVNTLNEQGICVSKVTYVWDGNNWIFLDKIEYEYNGEKLLSVSHSTWNNSKNAWDNPQKKIF